MAISASKMFSRDELSYCEMVANGGIFVGDRWFSRNSPESERAGYFSSYLRRQERNKRRRERRKERQTELRQRPLPRRLAVDHESQIANRMPLERRKCSCRSTIAECPTASEIRTAWHFRNVSQVNRLRLGGMLLDLECYVDNSLITIVHRNLLKIVGRHGGVKAWIRENCPELEPHYKTLQRIKGLAKRMRQRLDVLDPIPLSVIMDRSISAEEISSAPVHIQPRRTEAEVRVRFPWEHSEPVFDADGRVYFHNENYFFQRFELDPDIIDSIHGLRSIFVAAISLNDEEKFTIETYSNVETKVDLGGGWRGFFKEAVPDPEFWKDAGRQFVKDLKQVAADVLLPERTLRLIARGEKVGVGRVMLDWMHAYMDFYDSALVYKWGKVSRKELEGES